MSAIEVNVRVITPVDDAVDKGGLLALRMLEAVQAADSVSEALVIRERAETLVRLFIDVSTAALRRADVVGNR